MPALLFTDVCDSSVIELIKTGRHKSLPVCFYEHYTFSTTNISDASGL